MPLNIARLAFGLLVGVMVVPPAALRAQAPSPEPARIDLRTRLPHDTSVYLTWCGTGSMPAGYAGSATQKCFAETDLHLIAEKFIPELARSIEGLVVGQLDPDFPKPAEGEPAPGAFRTADAITKLLEVLIDRPAAVAVGLDLSAAEDAEAEAEPKFWFALMLDAGPQADRLAAVLSQLLADAGEPDSMQTTRVGTWLILHAQNEALVAALEGRSRRTLADNEVYRAACERVVAEPVSSMFLHLRPEMRGLVNILLSSLPADFASAARTALDETGLLSLDHLLLANGFDRGDFVTQAWLAHDGAPRGWVKRWTEPQPFDRALLRVIPADATYAAASQFDFKSLIDMVFSIAAESDEFACLEELYAAWAKDKNIDPLGDGLGQLGTCFVSFSSPSVGGPGSTVTVWPLRDASKFGRLMKGLAAMGGWQPIEGFRYLTIQFMQRTIKGVDLLTVPLVLVNVSLSVEGGFLVAGLAPADVVASVLHIRSMGTDGPVHAGLDGLLKPVEGRRPLAAAWLDVRPTLETNYAANNAIFSLLPSLASVVFNVKQIPLMPQPPLPLLRSLAKPVTSHAWADDKGFFVETRESYAFCNLLGQPSSSIAQVIASGPVQGIINVISVITALGNAAEPTFEEVFEAERGGDFFDEPFHGMDD